jgi:hypothetical protein
MFANFRAEFPGIQTPGAVVRPGEPLRAAKSSTVVRVMPLAAINAKSPPVAASGL